MAQKMGLSDHCEWLGQIFRSTALKKMQSAHALVVTSVHDLTSTVVVEALANGLPVLCPEHCGFKDAVNSSCGVLVNASAPELLISGLSHAIEKIYDEDFRFELAKGAFAHSYRYEWDLKARAINDIYYAKSQDASKTLRSLSR
jgi:glycosyltransferase involved in cell wall biosynthesis